MALVLNVTINGQPVVLTVHALTRWSDRVCPDDSFDEALAKLRVMIKTTGRIKTKRPGWTFGTGDLKHKILTEGYLVTDQPRVPGQPRREVAFPLTLLGADLRATTALVQGYDRRD